MAQLTDPIAKALQNLKDTNPEAAITLIGGRDVVGRVINVDDSVAQIGSDLVRISAIASVMS